MRTPRRKGVSPQRTLNNALAAQAMAEDRYKHEVGIVIEFDQGRPGCSWRWVQTTGGADDAYLNLITARSVSPLTKIKVADTADRTLSPALAGKVEARISDSLGRQPSLQIAYAAEKASLANVRSARTEFLPKVFLSATGSYGSGARADGAGQSPPTVSINGSRLSGDMLAGVTRVAALAHPRAKPIAPRPG